MKSVKRKLGEYHSVNIPKPYIKHIEEVIGPRGGIRASEVIRAILFYYTESPIEEQNRIIDNWIARQNGAAEYSKEEYAFESAALTRALNQVGWGDK